MKTKRPPAGPFAQNLRELLVRSYDALDSEGKAAVAERLGMSARRLNRLAIGESRPCLEDLPRLAREFGVRPETLAWCSTEELLRRLKGRAA